MRGHRQTQLQARAERIAEGLRDSPREPDDMRGHAFQDRGKLGLLVSPGFGKGDTPPLDGRFHIADESELDRPVPARRGFGALREYFESLVNRLRAQHRDAQRLLGVETAGRATVADGPVPGCSAATIRASG